LESFEHIPEFIEFTHFRKRILNLAILFIEVQELLAYALALTSKRVSQTKVTLIDIPITRSGNFFLYVRGVACYSRT